VEEKERLKERKIDRKIENPREALCRQKKYFITPLNTVMK